MGVLREVRPDIGEPGDVFTAKLLGDALSRTSDVSFGPGIEVGPPIIIDDGEVRVKVRIQDSAIIGRRDVTTTDPSGGAVLPNGFTVI